MINLLPNALILRKDKSILFSRVVMVSLIHTSFNISILILTALILTLTTFYPKKVFLNQISSLSFLLLNGGAAKFNYYVSNRYIFKCMVYLKAQYLFRALITVTIFSIVITANNIFGLLTIVSLSIYIFVALLPPVVTDKEKISILARIRVFFSRFYSRYYLSLVFINVITMNALVNYMR
jgi:hypothetical protein